MATGSRSTRVMPRFAFPARSVLLVISLISVVTQAWIRANMIMMVNGECQHLRLQVIQKRRVMQRTLLLRCVSKFITAIW